MNNFTKTILPKLTLGLFFVVMIFAVGWGLQTAITATPENPLLGGLIQNSPSVETHDNASLRATDNYTLTDNAEAGIDVELKTKTPFKMNFPITLKTPISVSSNGQTMEIIQQDGTDFRKISQAQITKTENNAKLLGIIQKDQLITAYQNTESVQAFYTYQAIVGEQKQSLFKNWILYDTPVAGVMKVSYEMKNAIVNIDSSGDAQIYFDSGKSTNSRPSDFTIPKPYFLDKDAARTDLNWQFDKTSHTLSVSLTAKPEQFPIALDPSVLKTDTVIATFSGKAVAMKFTCGDTVTYGSQTYDTVLIGTQCWFRQNLNVGTDTAGTTMPADPAPTLNDPSTVQKWCYGNSSTNCATDGGLYTWAEANALTATCNSTSCTPAVPNQGICPNGWHIPTHDEWTTLERAVCTSGTCVADFPFDITTTGWRGTNEGSKLSTFTLSGNNSSGFTGVLAGFRNTDGSFYTRGSGASLWSASAGSAADAWSRALGSGFATVGRYPNSKAFGFSVRCVKN